MLGYLPSPAHGIVHIGPLQLHAYGLMLAIGVLAAAKIADIRWRRSGHDSKVIAEIAVPVVVAGVIGARVYHLFTGYSWDAGGVTGAFEIWKGGLSIWGAVGGGLLAVLFISRRRHLDTLALSTRSARAWWSRKRSAVGATTSTRSSSGGRASCRGRSRSMPRTGRSAMPS